MFGLMQGIAELLQAVHLPSFPSEMHILLADKQNEEIKAIRGTEATVRLSNRTIARDGSLQESKLIEPLGLRAAWLSARRMNAW